jgi:ketosteroid isomerase-like protein
VSTRDLIQRFIDTLEARDWDGWAATMTTDVVYELPQSHERIRGRDRYVQFNQEFPGDWHLRPHVVIADDDNGSIWFKWRVGESADDDAMVFFGFRDGLIATVTDFWPETYEPPAGREHLVERW